MIKLLAVDMDGTCLDGRSRMSAENLAALRRAAEAGILVVPTTGRSLSCLPYRLRSEKDVYKRQALSMKIRPAPPSAACAYALI